MLTGLLNIFLVLVIGFHFVFLLVVLAGAIPVLRWPKLAWGHLPCTIWGIMIEARQCPCPLTEMETVLRVASNRPTYEGGFIAHYVHPMLSGIGLGPRVQGSLLYIALAITVSCYGWLIIRTIRAKRKVASAPPPADLPQA